MNLKWPNVWFESKSSFASAVEIAPDLMLHVNLGLALFLAFAVLLRTRRNGMLLAWSIVAGVQGLNEVVDACARISFNRPPNWFDAFGDIVLTLFWPTVILLSWRWIGPAR